MDAATLLFLLSGIAGPLLLVFEARVHGPEWSAWRSHLANVSLGDMLLARHIPRLRGERRCG